jgi:hypothetical protein
VIASYAGISHGTLAKINTIVEAAELMPICHASPLNPHFPYKAALGSSLGNVNSVVVVRSDLG